MREIQKAIREAVLDMHAATHALVSCAAPSDLDAAEQAAEGADEALLRCLALLHELDSVRVSSVRGDVGQRDNSAEILTAPCCAAAIRQ